MHGHSVGRLRSLPQVQKLLETPEAAALLERFSHRTVTTALRAALATIREELSRADSPDAVPSPREILQRARRALLADQAQVLRRVVNATGIVLHTNLGRAPLAPEAVSAMCEAARYANLEFDLEEGVRGSRLGAVASLLCRLSGAEAALAVNNNAAAVLLALTGLAGGGEIIVSRGELVEIGGGFRIPDVIRQSSARLVEVGTTNKTRLSDYEAAISDQTRVLLKVHQSNYRIVGFTAEAPASDLARLARKRGLLMMIDLGSGTVADLTRFGRHHEPTVRESLGTGADLVTFSGDKLMGGPQAGLLVGTDRAIDPLEAHPLMRALRLDKVTLAALEATLRLYVDEDAAVACVPTLRMLAQEADALTERAERLLALLHDLENVRIEATTAYAGGGALPDQAIPSCGVSVALPELPATELARRLRLNRPAIVGRVQNGRLLLDMLTVADCELETIAAALRLSKTSQDA